MKRHLIAATLLAAFCTVSFVLPAVASQPCPLPADSATTTNSSENARSPEQAPPPNRIVFHNGKALCLPEPAAEAHARHGDATGGPCTQRGNQG